MTYYLLQLNYDIFFIFHNLASQFELVRILAYFIAEHFDIIVLSLACLFFGYSTYKKVHKGWRGYFSRPIVTEGIQVVTAVIGAWLISQFLKTFVALPRPFLSFPDITPLFVYGGYNSFPSGHATLFAALGMIIFFRYRKAGIFFLLCAFVIGISRIIVGIHFPLDVLFGWILGCFVAWLVYRLSFYHQQ